MSVRVTIVIPAYNEGEDIVPVLLRLQESVSLSHETTVIVDDPTDTTISAVVACQAEYPQVRYAINTYGRGPGNAIRYGIDQAEGAVVVVTMADGCDDPTQIDNLVRLVERGVVVAVASRYTRGGQQVGGPAIKGFISRAAGLSLYYFARVGTRDATNSFKAYSAPFVRAVGIESNQGFEIGIEMVAKARRARLPVAELPTIWLDRAFGASNFKMLTWMARYLHWYCYAFGPRKLVAEFSSTNQPYERNVEASS
jgi:glycosyltransferase involved in cell wall biosynthesis